MKSHDSGTSVFWFAHRKELHMVWPHAALFVFRQTVIELFVSHQAFFAFSLYLPVLVNTA